MESLRVGITGCAGRMGQEIARCVIENPGMKLTAAIERPGHPAAGRDMFQLLGMSGGPKIAEHLSGVLDAADVFIDFSTPEASMENFGLCAGRGKGLVIGTTGFSPEQRAEMESRRAGIRCVISPNMSVGVNVMFKILAEAARAVGKKYDIEIVEMHHRLKKDAPSGTAMRLAEICARETGRDIGKVGRYGREGIVGERTDDEIAVMTLRGGDVVGEHTVIFAGPGERLEITHKATSRRNFAAGAVAAAAWLAGKKNGIYDMRDVLGL